MIRAWSFVVRWLASRRRRVILAVAAALYIATVLFAPWSAKGSAHTLTQLMQDGISLNRYGPIVFPPDCHAISGGWSCRYELNVTLLLIEWVFIAIAMTIVWLWNKD